jgi:hypothetical protein
MGELKEGDYVFDETGKPTKIVFKTDPMYDHKCYRIHFSDGNTVDCDEEHLWETTTHHERKNIARALNPNDRCKSTNAKPRVRTTNEILETLTVEIGGKARPNHAIPLVSGPLRFDTGFKSIIDPYVLGCWLSDGSLHRGSIATIDDFILDEIRKFYPKINHSTYKDHYITGIVHDLRSVGVLDRKHIPEGYLTANSEIRLSLLQGMMDSDGTVSKRGDCTFDNTNKNLADGVEALAISLGIKCTRNGRYGYLNGEKKKWCYRVHFTTDLPVFRLPRKLDRIRPLSSKGRMRYITKVEPIPTEPVQCIEVDNPRHLFLIGKGCIPTHNTVSGTASRVLAWAKP